MTKSGAAKRSDPIRRDRSDWSAAATLLTVVFLIAATFLSWRSVLKNQDAYLADQARERIEFLSARLDAHVRQRISIGALVEEE